MKGKWDGFYKFDKKNLQNKNGFEKTLFHISIDSHEKNHFGGMVVNDVSTNGTPGVGDIDGYINGNKIEFVKRMPIKAGNKKSNKIIEFKGKYGPIFYEGTFSEDKTFISGTWKKKFGLSFIGFFILLVTTKGTWEMNFTESL
jgi:hypothetical protein